MKIRLCEFFNVIVAIRQILSDGEIIRLFFARLKLFWLTRSSFKWATAKDGDFSSFSRFYRCFTSNDEPPEELRYSSERGTGWYGIYELWSIGVEEDKLLMYLSVDEPFGLSYFFNEIYYWRLYWNKYAQNVQCFCWPLRNSNEQSLSSLH